MCIELGCLIPLKESYGPETPSLRNLLSLSGTL